MPILNAVRAHHFLALLAAWLIVVSNVDAAAPRVLLEGTLPHDSRLAPLKDLNGYFPFTPPKSKAEWDARADRVRRQILVAEGLWPMPTKTPLNAVIHGKIDRPEYTIEKVYFESAPGFFVTGNLYRPKNVKGKVPGVLFAHGHWRDARLSLLSDDALKKELATHQEFFDHGGRSMFQSMCVQLARMGCVVWQWDMLGESDSVQLSHALIHEFAKSRPEMNTRENWGLFSPQAEAHLQSVMGLQTLNAIRSLDFLLTLPEVDPDRIAMTGASGGGTQTMILSAIDPRVKLEFPAVMVSTAMQGGCTCENASLLRVNTGNVEFAALFAPKPLGMTTANDWTKEMSSKGFPELQQLYALLGKPNEVTLARGEQFPHNYNAVSRAAFYKWLNEHFKLVPPEAVVKKDYEPLGGDQLTVWDKDHPAPKAADANFERGLLRWFTKDADKQLRAAASSPDEFRKLAAPAVEVMIGRTYDAAGDTEWDMTEKTDRGDYLEMTGLVRNKTYNEELPVVWLYPKKWTSESSPSVTGQTHSEPSPSGESSSRGRGQGEGALESTDSPSPQPSPKGRGRTSNARRVVLWLDDAGKSALLNREASAERLRPAIKQLLDSGATVLGIDLLYQGEFLKDSQPLKQTRTVQNKRESAAYTFGYNHSVFAQRTHDILTLVKFIHTAKIPSIPGPTSVAVAAFGHTGPIAAAARAVSGDAIDAAAIDTAGFRFADVLDYRDPMFLPGGAKYLGVPGLLALGAPNRLWLSGEERAPGVVAQTYRKLGQRHELTFSSGDASVKESAAATWLAQ